MSIRVITPNFHNFCPKYIHCFPSFLIDFALIFPLLLPEFPIAFAQISRKAMWNSGKTNGKIWAKAMRKLGKRRHIFRVQIIAFARISHCFFPNFPITLISHCFCPNLPLLLPEFFVFKIFREAQCSPASPPPTPMMWAWRTWTSPFVPFRFNKNNRIVTPISPFGKRAMQTSALTFL